MSSSPSLHAWSAAGSPAHPYLTETCAVPCATCGAAIASGVPLAQIEKPSTANHADYFRFASKHICVACAWLYSAGKGRPGNYIATPDRIEYTVISLESMVLDKRPWIQVLPEIAALAPDTPVAGVMTTDVKPRLWPRVRLATVERFGLYVHAPDYDISEWRAFDLRACLALVAEMLQPLAAGYAKASLYHGLLRDYARSSRAPARALTWDTALAAHRGQPHFLPALITAGVTSENKCNDKSIAGSASNIERSTAGSDRNYPAQPRLL